MAASVVSNFLQKGLVLRFQGNAQCTISAGSNSTFGTFLCGVLNSGEYVAREVADTWCVYLHLTMAAHLHNFVSNADVEWPFLYCTLTTALELYNV